MKKKHSESPLYLGTHSYITPTHIVLRDEYLSKGFKKTRLQKLNEKNLKDNKTKGKISKKALSNIRTAVNWLYHSAEYKPITVKSTGKKFWFKINFITLTIPVQIDKCITSKEFQGYLNTWLVYARKYFYLHNYIWKVEQHKSGNLHIHITTDTFINQVKLKNSWNRILQKNNLLNEFYSKYGHYNPNSTDIHAVYKVDNIAGYICKYMSKDPALSADFKGRIWGCSQSLSAKNKCRIFFDAGYDNAELKKLCNSKIEWKPIETKEDSMGRKGRIGTIYFPSVSDWLTTIDGRLREAYNNHRWYIRNNTPKPPIEYMTIDYLSIQTINKYNLWNQQNQEETIKQNLNRNTHVPNAEQVQLNLY